MNQAKLRSLFRSTLSKIDSMGANIVGLVDHLELEIDPQQQELKVERKTIAATDSLKAFVRASTMTSDMVADVDAACARALANPTEVASPLSDPEIEVFLHEEILRTFAARIGAVHDLDTIDARPGLNLRQAQLVDICENIGATVRHLADTGSITLPSYEHHVKHVLFSATRASFRDAVPDGGTTFQGPLRKSVPDFGVPRLRTCVELKVARTRDELDTMVGQIVSDMSLYGSPDYSNFVGVIYTNNDELTEAMMMAAAEHRLNNLNADPKYDWTWVLSRGPLGPKKKMTKPAQGVSDPPGKAI